ncbi:MAG: phosphoribosylamine--glycine ligase [Bacteriovoracaceae bacterium]
MRILLIGSGGRESALAWKMASSSLVTSVMVSPGNSGMKKISNKISLVNVSTWESYLEFKVDLVVIGPEAPLMEGLSDFFEKEGIPVVGPSQKAAMLEGSKAFCKEIFELGNIPTPFYQIAESVTQAKILLSTWKLESVVVKVDALAQGKGVVVCDTLEKAVEVVDAFFDGSFLGYPVKKILLEEKIIGPEASAFALCDGENFLYLGSATDYKRLLDQDQGPNTGGMGAISPSPILTDEDETWIKENIFAPTLKVMKERGTLYKGFLFVGLMKTEDGLKALEFNTRLGDPETQSLIPRITQDLVPLLMAAATKGLHECSLQLSKQYALHIVLAAQGYPGTHGQKIRQGDLITLDRLNEGNLFFPASVIENESCLLTNGGRVCGLTVLASQLEEARDVAYQEISKIHFTGAHFRRDIGVKFL